MEDTLRYFFSAIFQGIAAILTLGAMFYMNYQDKVKSRKEELIEKAEMLTKPHTVEEMNIEIEQNRIEVLRYKRINNIGNLDDNRPFMIIDEYDELNENVMLIKGIIPSLLLSGIALLVISSIALFCIGYSKLLNLACFYMGLFVFVLIGLFLWKLMTILVITAELDSIKLSDLFKTIIKNK